MLRIPFAAIGAVTVGGFANLVSRDLLHLPRPVQLLLWAVFTAIGASAGWTAAANRRISPPRVRIALVIVLVIGALASEVLVVEPWNAVGALLLIAGAGALFLLNYTRRDRLRVLDGPPPEER